MPIFRWKPAPADVRCAMQALPGQALKIVGPLGRATRHAALRLRRGNLRIEMLFLVGNNALEILHR